MIAALQPKPAVVEKQEDFSPSAVKVEQPVVFKEPPKPERPKKKHAPKPSFKLPKGDPGSDIIPADIASRGDVVIRRYHLSQLSKYLLTADDDYENISKSKHGSSFVFVVVYRILRVIYMFCRAAKSMRHKNRYGDILPYDDTRVHISTSEADHDEFANYINAKYNTHLSENDLKRVLKKYGMKNSRLVLQTIASYIHEQGLSQRPIQIEDIFAASTLEL